jgi:type IV pilus assembly protein PilC
MKFSYKAIDKNGETITGTGDAETRFDLAKDLKAQGLDVVSVEDLATAGKKSKFAISLGGIPIYDRVIFARNVATMLRAGLALSRALAIQSRQTKNTKFKATIDSVNEKIKKGVSLRDSLASFPKVFSTLFVSMVAAGEESGKLSESLDIVANQMEKTYTLKKKIKGAMMYPSIVLVAMIGIGVFMLMFVVPSLVGIFEDMEVELPVTTRAIIALSDFAQANGLLLLAMIIAVIVGIWSYARTKRGGLMVDWIVLHIPLITPLYKQTIAARTTRTLSSLLSSGVPVIQAIAIVNETINNSYFKAVLNEAAKRIQVGQPMSAVFIESEAYYPSFVGEMISVGEETGELGHMLASVADFYEKEVDQSTRDMSTIIEPIMMIVVGGGVGFFAISMISPMYSLVQGF